MKLLIAGSRSIMDIDISPYIPDDTDVIISGDAKGVDKLAEAYADKMRLSKIIMRPQYSLYKRGAPIKRNQQMVDMCGRVLVFGTVTAEEQSIPSTTQKGQVTDRCGFFKGFDIK